LLVPNRRTNYKYVDRFLTLGQPVGDLLTEGKLSIIGTSVESSKKKVPLAQQMGTSASSARYAA
jgi:hypothetical protein